MSAEQDLQLFGDVKTMLIFSAVLAGIAARTIWEARDKFKDGEIYKFDLKFLGTALLAFVSAGLPALALMPSATATFSSFMGVYGAIPAWLFTMAITYGTNHAINYGLKRVEKTAETNLLNSPKFKEAVSKEVSMQLRSNQSFSKSE